MPSDFNELIKVVGTFAFYVITAIVLIMLLVSLFDRHPGPKSEPKKNDEVNPKKPEKAKEKEKGGRL